jgi:serine/threonine protein kinase
MGNLREEVRTLCDLRHSNIARYYDVYEDDAYVHYIMERCSGPDLCEHLSAKGAFEESEAATYIRQVLSAIAYLHKRGITHRSITVDNIVFLNSDS